MITHDTPNSSNIAQVKYDDDRGTLYIDFRSGKTYRYDDVPYEIWNGLLEAPSVGQYFNQNIKNQYKGIPV
jgi:hypothetical protein